MVRFVVIHCASQLCFDRWSLAISYVFQVLRDGAEAADEVASETLGWAKEAMGLSALKDF